MPPAAAAIAAESIMAYIRQRAALMPAASAAGRFCLIASSERPKRERSTCSEMTMQITTTTMVITM